MKQIGDLINKAMEARDNAYAPYSKFRVGAVLLASDGTVYTGCNVENVSFGATCCAERVAIFSAIVEGKRNFETIVVVSDSNELVFPCGICRQVILEFGIPTVVVSDSYGQWRQYKTLDLLPYAFDKFD
jgi:cytidine deaminase